MTLVIFPYKNSLNSGFKRHSRYRITVKMLMLNDVYMIWVKEEVAGSGNYEDKKER